MFFKKKEKPVILTGDSEIDNVLLFSRAISSKHMDTLLKARSKALLERKEVKVILEWPHAFLGAKVEVQFSFDERDEQPMLFDWAASEARVKTLDAAAKSLT